MRLNSSRKHKEKSKYTQKKKSLAYTVNVLTKIQNGAKDFILGVFQKFGGPWVCPLSCRLESGVPQFLKCQNAI